MPLPRRLLIARRARILVDALEPRTLLTTPGNVQPDTLAGFDKGERQALIARFTNLSSQSSLAGRIGNGSSARLADFDDALQSYMRSRTNVSYFFANNSQQANADFMKANLTISKAIDHADKVVDDRLFPATSNDNTYTKTMTGNIDFRAPAGDKGGSFAQSTNRFEYFGNLADAVWVGNDKAKYTNEITYEVARWAEQFGTNLDAPSDWSAVGKSGWTFLSAIRAESWIGTYFKLNSVDNTAFGGADDTLMLYELVNAGDWLYAQSKTAKADASVDSNKSIALAKSLCYLGRMFPELDTAAAWETKGRQLLFDSVAAQIYDDGSHREQSPGYAIGVAEDVLDVFLLDKINGDASLWAGKPRATLDKMVESYRQFLDPDGKRPGIGDTFRTLSVGSFLKAGVILDKIHPTTTTSTQSRGTTQTTITVADASQIRVGDVLTPDDQGELLRVAGKSGNTLTVERAVGGSDADNIANGLTIYDLGDQPFARATIGDVWLLGINATTPFAHVPGVPDGVLGTRGRSYAMPDSGNYILRSDDSSSATQITFDAGPKGGFHGHNDLLNFELWSGGRPLIVDPGPYQYAASADRDYVVSTKAHNTINVDGQNTGAVEGENQPAITATYDFGANSATLQGTHSAYAYLTGAPVLSRAIWYDYGDTMVVVDFAESSTKHDFSQSFNVPGTSDANVAGASGGTEFKTRFTTGDNVRVKTINGGTLTKGAKTFVTGDVSNGYKSDAYRYTVAKDGQTFAVFVTLVNVYTGQTVPNVDAQLLTSNPQPGQPIQVKLTRDGATTQTLTFQQPALERPTANLNEHALVSDFAYDSAGNLHLAYQDLEQKYLRYTVKDASTGKWSPVVTVDDSAHGVGAQIDLAFDNDGRPGIAYYDSANGDLKYAILSKQNNAWRTQTVDSKTTVGQNPSLLFTRTGNGPIISYYNRTKGDLKVATQTGQTSWDIRTLDSKNDVGRYSQISLDPNRTDLNARYVVAYEDRTNHGFKYGYTSGSSFKTDTITPKGVTTVGDRLSLAWEDTGTGSVGTPSSKRFLPRFSFYEYQPDASLWFASRDGDGKWTTKRLDGSGSTKKFGGYNQLSYATGVAEVFYYDSKNNQLRHGIADGDNANWTFTTVGTGGREGHVSRYKKKWSVMSFNDDDELLSLRTV